MRKLRNLFRGRRSRLEEDLERELQYHVDRRVEALVADGLDATEARRQAQLELGGVPQVQEAVRDTWIWRALDDLARDGRVAIRSLRRSPGFTLAAGSVLALTIGASTAIFSVVDGVLLRPLPYPDAERLVTLETVWIDASRSSRDVSGPDFLDWQARADLLETTAVVYTNTDDAIVVGDGAVFGNTAYVSAGFFDVFGQTAAAGRLLDASDLPPDDTPAAVAVVAASWAISHFGSAEAAIGRTIAVYGNVVRIVGVAAPGFRYPDVTDIWAPERTAARPESRGDHFYQAVAKIKPGVELASADAQIRAIGDALARVHPENRMKTARARPLQDHLTGDVAATLWALMAAVGAVWLIGCANIANLLMARAASRSREIALRSALGAGRGRVLRQLMTESTVLAVAAGAAGVLLASILLQMFLAAAPAALAVAVDVRLDLRVLSFAVALSLGSTIVFGLVPAVHAYRFDLAAALKQGGRGTISSGGAGFRSALVIAEVAVSVVLLTAAVLLARSLLTLQAVDTGFTTDRVLVANTEHAIREGEHFEEDIFARVRFYDRILERVRALPGVQAASGVAYLGLGREPRSPRDFYVQGRPDGPPGERLQAEYHAITGGYFHTLDVPIRAGRDFGPADTPDRPRVAIVNETLARTVFAEASPIGKRIRPSPGAPWMEIVGVAGDTRWQDPSQPARPVIYAAATQGAGNSLAILVRSNIDDSSLAGTLRALLHAANPSVPVTFDTLHALVDSTFAYPRFRTYVIGLFAGMAALLAALGLFSVLAYLVVQRTTELAVRRALGASGGHVVRLVLGHALRLCALGLVVGLAGAMATARLLQEFLFEVSPWDAGAYLVTVAVFAGAVLLAAFIPALRAATIAPTAALQAN